MRVFTHFSLNVKVNSPDDNGAVMGNWTSEFEGGTPPTKWVGSMKILQTFHKTHRPVKYGQCWVFSGVLGTRKKSEGRIAQVSFSPTTKANIYKNTKNVNLILRGGDAFNDFWC